MKFDVYVNAEEEAGPMAREFAGSFVNVPHMEHGKKEKKKKKMLKRCVRLGITEVLEDLEAEEDDEVVVTIVPRVGKGLVSIGSVKIELLD